MKTPMLIILLTVTSFTYAQSQQNQHQKGEQRQMEPQKQQQLQEAQKTSAMLKIICQEPSRVSNSLELNGIVTISAEMTKYGRYNCLRTGNTTLEVKSCYRGYCQSHEHDALSFTKEECFKSTEIVAYTLVQELCGISDTVEYREDAGDWIQLQRQQQQQGQIIQQQQRCDGHHRVCPQ